MAKRMILWFLKMNPMCPDILLHSLEQVFENIQRKRMSGVPILNQELKVEAVGFISCEFGCLGVLITPWFMNLMLLPHDGDDWNNLALGSTNGLALPSGNYDFIVGEEESIGRYQSCSLFSPMFEFADQEAASATAEAVMSALMDEENRDDVSMKEKEIAEIWNGEKTPDQQSDENIDSEKAERPTLKERVSRPISRRQLLSGSFLSDDK